MNVDTVPRTLLVAAGVALFCSAMVSLAVHYLRPQQVALQSLERNRAILEAADLLPPGEVSDRELVSRYLDLDARVVDLDTAWFAEGFDAHAYDHWRLRDDVQAAASDDGRRYVPVYLVRKAGRLEKFVLPVDGGGMWSTIYGYVALGEDLNTITGVTFHRHGETPGVGDRIQDEAWLTTWNDKRILDADGAVRFRVTRDATGPFEVDLISGASVTSEATGEFVRSWFGDAGYGPFLKTLDENER
jgi:Na+-transporting NADH:ubiquinone oxidoreductase subunit C